MNIECLSHPLVRDFYRDIIGRFLGEFPEISILFLFGLDADGEFCDSGSCPRCGGMSKFAQRDRLINFLIEEGQKIRPGLKVLTTGWGWERRDIQDFPLGIGAKIKRWRDLDVDGVFDHWGGYNEDISSNSIACREFFLNPSAEVKETCRKIALRQFGAKAGEVVFGSWCELEKAHEILSDHCHWSPGQWPGWYSGLDDDLSCRTGCQLLLRLLPNRGINHVHKKS